MSYNQVSNHITRVPGVPVNNPKVKSQLLSDLKSKCEGRHFQCSSYAEMFLSNPNHSELSQEMFTKYIAHISYNNSSYNSCVSPGHLGSTKIINFITNNSIKFIIDPCYYTVFIIADLLSSTTNKSV